LQPSLLCAATKKIHLHVETVMAAFDAPVDAAGVQHMQEIADAIREHLWHAEAYPWHLFSKIAHKKAAARCTAEAVADAIREHFLIRDFSDNGLTAGRG
jgi:hypothetical protein